MSLPLLTDPAQTFNLFAGQDAVLFLYDLPVINAGSSTSSSSRSSGRWARRSAVL